MLLSAEEKALFRRQARRAGMSLSGWLRGAALDRLAEAQSRVRFEDRAAVRAFFAKTARQQSGCEPDWQQHLEVIRRSQQSGTTDT